MPLKLTTYYRGSDLPELPGSNTFHSAALFRIYEATPGYTPILIVATEQGRPVARLLAGIRRSKRWLPASLARQCVVYGVGEFFTPLPETDAPAGTEREREEAIFGKILEHLTQEAMRSCFLIEFRNLENPLFAYGAFRGNGYFPVSWLRVRNSLHSVERVEERFSPSRLRQIRKGLRNGARVAVAQSEAEIQAFAHMLRKIYASRIRRYFPNLAFFRHINTLLAEQSQAQIFVVRQKERIIGGAVSIYSGANAYLWFSGGMRKSYALQYPGVLAVWKALEEAHRRGCRHMEFLDVGLPFRRHGYRDFVLRFGGKQSSTRRWFRLRWTWLNRLLVRFYV